MKQKNTYLTGLIILIVLAGILLLAAYLRLTNLAHNPGWYADEGTWLVINKHLLHHHSSYMAFDGSIFMTAKLPLFGFLLAAVSDIRGYGIETLRMVTASLGILSVFLLYVVMRQIAPEKKVFPLLCALMLTIYPNGILYSRLGFSYNLLTPLILLILLCLWKYLDSRRSIWILAASLILGIGTTSDLMITTLIPALILVILAVRWRDLFLSLPLMAAPFAIFVLIGWLLWSDDFIYDLKYLLVRIGDISPLIMPAAISINFQEAFTRDSWFVAGVIGLFLVEDRRLQKLLLVMFFASFIGIARTIALTSTSFYYVSPLFPLIAIGVASLLWRGTTYILALVSSSLSSLYDRWGWLPTSRAGVWLKTRSISVPSALFVYVLVISPFLITAWISVSAVNHEEKTYFDSILLVPDDAQAAADYINSHIDEQDVVLTSPGMAWLINGNVTDFQISMAAGGKHTQHFPDDIPAHRFSFDARYSNARYAVVDPVWRLWGVTNLPDLEPILDDIESWPRVFHAGDIDIYRNPAMTP